MAFSTTPWGHFPLMFFSWLSAITYFIILLAVFRERKHIFRCSYIPLFVAHSIADFLLFLQVEILSRPRKFNWFGLFNEDMSSLAKFTYLNTAIVRYALYIGHVVCAFNRYTVVKYPLNHGQMWTKSVTFLFVFASWWTATIVVLPGWILYIDDVAFQKKGIDGLLLVGGRFTQYDTTYGSILACCSLLACIYFYTYSFIHIRCSRHSNILGRAKLYSEKKLFLCALFSFFPFLIGSVRGSLGFISSYFNMPSLWVIGNDLWYYDTELTFCAQVWINVILVHQINGAVLRLITGRPPISDSKVSIEVSQRTRKITVPVFPHET